MNMSSLTFCFLKNNIAYPNLLGKKGYVVVVVMLHGEFIELYAEYNLSYMLEHAMEIASM